MGSPELVASPRGLTPGAADAQPGARAGVLFPLAALIVLVTVGAVVRLVFAAQPLFADELSTYWISATHGLGGVLSLLYGSGRIHHAEITPPLSFLASWVTSRFGHSALLLRTPALLAGTATIPMVYVLGLRTVGRRAALVAAALTAFSPFMIYYSAEARAYGLMMLFVVAAVFALLRGLDTGQRRWWGAYVVLSAAAFYTHYTSAFVLGAALVWALWAHPEHRRAAVLANVLGAALVLPWVPGLVNDLHSPTVRILSALSPFNGHAIRLDIQHWAVGYPYTVVAGLRALPGTPALILLALAAVLAVAGLGTRLRAVMGRDAGEAGLRARIDAGLVLVVLLAAATPVGESVASALGSHIIGVRDLAASWPFLGLAAGAALTGAGRRLGVAAAALAVVAFALGGARMLEGRFARPAYQAAADYLDRAVGARDVVIDLTLTPGPLTPLDITLHRQLRLVRGNQPAERDHPFGFADPIVPLSTAVREAVRAAGGARVWVVGPASPGQRAFRAELALLTADFPSSYRLSSLRAYGGIEPTLVALYARAPG